MPLPPTPTNRPNNAVNRAADHEAENELLIKGGLCALIGVSVLLSPYFLKSPALRDTVMQASAAGWFALVLGGAFLAVYVRRRLSAQSKP